MTDAANSYAGKRLGLPESGPGSIAKLGRRIGALAIDYAASTVIAMAFLQYNPMALPSEAGWRQFAPMMVFAVLNILFIPTAGGTPGHRLVGMRIIRLVGGWSGLWRPLIRTLLLVVVIPAVIWDADGRGLHDKAVGLVLVRA